MDTTWMKLVDELAKNDFYFQKSVKSLKNRKYLISQYEKKLSNV